MRVSIISESEQTAHQKKWSTVTGAQLPDAMSQAKQLGLHLFIWDRTGEASLLFDMLNGLQYDMIPLMVDVALAEDEDKAS